MNCPRCGRKSESSSVMCGMCFGQVTQPGPQMREYAAILGRLDEIIHLLRSINVQLDRSNFFGR